MEWVKTCQILLWRAKVNFNHKYEGTFPEACTIQLVHRRLCFLRNTALQSLTHLAFVANIHLAIHSLVCWYKCVEYRIIVTNWHTHHP